MLKSVQLNQYKLEANSDKFRYIWSILDQPLKNVVKTIKDIKMLHQQIFTEGKRRCKGESEEQKIHAACKNKQ